MGESVFIKKSSYLLDVGDAIAGTERGYSAPLTFLS